MRIGINCVKVRPSYVGGVNSYTFGLIDGLLEVNHGNTICIFVCRKNQHLFRKYQDHKNVQVIRAENDSILTLIKKAIKALSIYIGNRSLFRVVNDLLFRNVARAINNNSDIIYIPTTLLDYFSYEKPVVLSMHDIQFVHFPEHFSKRSLIYGRILFDLSARYADCFQASSNFIKDDLLKHFPNLRGDQIVVIPEGVNVTEFRERHETPSICEKYGLPEDFLFFPAQLWKHKNHITVLKALNILRNNGLRVPLVMTGQKYAAAEEIFDYIKGNDLTDVYYLGVVPFRDLVALYQRASYLITAVLYESSSLPILEAAAAGTPIIASKTPPNVEMSNVLSINLFDPLDENELAGLIDKLWKNEKISAKQIQHNKEHIQYYSWENAAARYLEFFRNGPWSR